MKKRIVSLFFAFVVMFSVFVPGAQKEAEAFYDTGLYYISFYDTILEFDENPVRTNATILAQADVLCKCMETELSYSKDTGGVSLKKGNTQIDLCVGSLAAKINGKEETLPAAPIVKNDRLMIPTEFVANALGYNTYYTTNFQKRLSIDPKPSAQTFDALSQIENECFSEKLVDWIVNLYDPESGGFYFKKSSKDTLGFLPDRESTANCIGMLRTMGVIGDDPKEWLTDEMIDKMTEFARKYYNPNDGFWYELPWGEYVNESKRGYESSGASQVLKYLGKPIAEKSSGASLNSFCAPNLLNGEINSDSLCENVLNNPLETEPEISLNEMSVEQRYSSLENFRLWLDSLDITNVYTTGSLLLTNLGSVRSAGDEYFDCLMEYIEEHMNPRTGFFSKIDPETGDWIDEIDYDAMSGTYKVSAIYAESFYASLKGRYYTMPYFDKLMENTMKVMLSDESGWHACDLANPWSLIRNARYSQKDVLGNPLYKAALDSYYEKLPELLLNTKEKILALLCEDGSYSYYAYTGAGGNKGVLQGLNIREGEMSGASMIVSVRKQIYNVLGLPLADMYDGAIGPGDIKEKLLSLEPTKKIEPAKVCDLTFDDMETGTLPNGNGSLWRYTGDIQIVNDPVSSHGKSIRIEGDSKTSPVLYFDVGSSGSRGFTLQFDIRFEPVEKDNLYMISEIGSWDMAVMTSYRKVDGYCRFIRTTNEGNKWLCNNKGNWWSTYRTVKIVYTPECSGAKTQYYLNGKLVDTSTYCSNGYSKMRPAKDISYVSFRADHTSPFVGYIDNFKFRENPTQ